VGGDGAAARFISAVLHAESLAPPVGSLTPIEVLISFY
jgi:hypothetical protein